MRHRHYLIFTLLMGGGAILGLLRGFVVSAVLTPPELGVYAVVMAVGMYASSLAGFGKIEELRKLLPRYFVDGNFSAIISEPRTILLLVGKRTLAATCLVFLVCLTFGYTTFAIYALIVGLMSFASAWSAVLASALRAGDGLGFLAWSAFIRGFSSLAIVSLASWKLGLIGGFCGEIVAAFLAATVMQLFLSQLKYDYHGNTSHGNFEPVITTAKSQSGLKVFAGGLVASGIFYLSRPLAGALFNPEELGTFGFLMILVTTVVTAIGIFDQAAGPYLVRSEHVSFSTRSTVKLFTLYVAMLSAAMLVVWAALAAAKVAEIWPIHFYATKFKINNDVLAPTLVLCVLQFSSTLDWWLQARNRETGIVWAAIFSLAVFLVGFGLVHEFHKPLAIFIWLLCIAKLAQILLQIIYLIKTLTLPQTSIQL
jgi:O-antigen/teichoic acid export membrane protein